MSDVWYYAQGDHTVGPVALRELGSVLSRASDAGDLLVWRDGLEEWTRASDLQELAPYLVAPPPLPTPKQIGRSPPHVQKSSSTPPNPLAVLAGMILAALWAVSAYGAYTHGEVLYIALASLSAALIGVALWRRAYQASLGLLVGAVAGALFGLLAIEHRLDVDKATSLGFASPGDMHEGQRLNLSPERLAVYRAQEAARIANEEKARKEKQAAENACRQDWSRCADNSDVANKYSGWFDVKWDCKRAAENQAKYGDPEWPSYGAFGSFMRGKDYVEKGIATAIETDAKFQNGFGAKVRVRVICTYDLRSKTVLSVNILEK